MDTNQPDDRPEDSHAEPKESAVPHYTFDYRLRKFDSLGRWVDADPAERAEAARDRSTTYGWFDKEDRIVARTTPSEEVITRYKYYEYDAGGEQTKATTGGDAGNAALAASAVAADNPAASAGQMAACPDCDGIGLVTLLTSSRACSTCGGSGSIGHDGGGHQ